MIVRHRRDLLKTKNHAVGDVWSSTRFFIKSDGLGFSFHETIIKANSIQKMWYKNHTEAVIISKGKAEIENIATGEIFPLEEGSGYVLTGDKHIFRTFTDVVCYCVFNPPLEGDETHDSDGSFPLSKEE